YPRKRSTPCGVCGDLSPSCDPSFVSQNRLKQLLKRDIVRVEVVFQHRSAITWAPKTASRRRAKGRTHCRARRRSRPIFRPVEELHVVGHDLRRAPLLALVLVFAHLEPPLDADETPFCQVVGTHLGQSPPRDDAEEIRLALALLVGAGPDRKSVV